MVPVLESAGANYTHIGFRIDRWLPKLLDPELDCNLKALPMDGGLEVLKFQEMPAAEAAVLLAMLGT